MPLLSSVAVCRVRAVLMLNPPGKPVLRMRRIENFRGRQRAAGASSAGDKHAAVSQKCRAMIDSRSVQRALALDVCVSGSKISEAATRLPSVSRPPVIRIRPSESAVAV